MLKEMRDCGYHMAVASSKPECFVKDILEHFNIAHYFEVVVGSELDGGRVDKAEVIQEALNRLFHYGRMNKAQIVMVGDRKFDVEGAKEIGVASVAVGYGYGPKEELEEAMPDYMAATVKELRDLFISDELILQKKEEQRRLAEEYRASLKKEEGKPKGKVNPMQVVWKFLFPFLMFYFAGEFLRQAAGFLLMFLAEHNEAVFKFAFVAEDSDAERWAVSGNGTAIIQILALIGVFILLYKMGDGKENLEKGKRPELKFKAFDWFRWTLSAVALSVGINIIFISMGWLEASESYQEAASNLYAVSIPAGILLYGIYSPLAEELLFRGIIYNEVKTIMQTKTAALLAAVLFGIYHGNLVQFVYSVALGLVLAYAYQYSGQFAVPVVIHGVVNVIVFLSSNLGMFAGVQLTNGIAMTAVGAWLFSRLIRIYRNRERKLLKTF